MSRRPDGKSRGEWLTWVAAAAVIAVAHVWSRSRPSTFHSFLDGSVGRRCPQCEVALGQEHLTSCFENGRWDGRLRGMDNTRKDPPSKT